MTAMQLTDGTRHDALQLIRMALSEDLGSADLATGRDCTTAAIVPGNIPASAALVSREAGIVCGVEIANLVIEHHAATVQIEVAKGDGDHVDPGETIAVLSGPADEILVLERTCLNFMCRLSGISSSTRKYVDRIEGTGATVLDTRKTTPGWRRLEKYAVACGGGQNHRMGLYDAIMIKDNHLAFRRSIDDDVSDGPLIEDGSAIEPAIALARQWINDNAATLPHGKQTVLQLEVDNLQQLRIALSTDCDIILLDNMSCEQMAEAVSMRNNIAPQILLEASGGVNLQTISAIAATGVERISVGALTHSAVNFDIGLDWSIER